MELNFDYVSNMLNNRNQEVYSPHENQSSQSTAVYMRDKKRVKKQTIITKRKCAVFIQKRKRKVWSFLIKKGSFSLKTKQKTIWFERFRFVSSVDQCENKKNKNNGKSASGFLDGKKSIPNRERTLNSNERSDRNNLNSIRIISSERIKSV